MLAAEIQASTVSPRMLQDTRLGADAALLLAGILGTVRDRQLVDAEVDALENVDIRQTMELWRVRRHAS